LGSYVVLANVSQDLRYLHLQGKAAQREFDFLDLDIKTLRSLESLVTIYHSTKKETPRTWIFRNSYEEFKSRKLHLVGLKSVTTS